MERKTKVKLQEAGITLVALVVTIIVLLILAGVTIALALSNNGIIQRAKEASGIWENATKNEKTMYTDAYKKIGELSGAPDEGIIITQEGITVDLATIASHYGDDVIYNNNRYQLFYVDLIGKYSGGVAGVWLQQKGSPNQGYSLSSHYNTELVTTADSVFWKVNPDLANSYGSTIRELSIIPENIKAAAGLCDTAYWNTDNKTYVTAEDESAGAFVIGGVSAEMFCDSYNAYRGKTSTDESYFNAKAYNEDGHFRL